MSLISEHLFNPKARQRLAEDLLSISGQGRRRLKELLKRQYKALRPPSRTDIRQQSWWSRNTEHDAGDRYCTCEDCRRYSEMLNRLDQHTTENAP